MGRGVERVGVDGLCKKQYLRNVLFDTSIFRLQIAALHFNENASKPQRQIKEGENAGAGMWLASYPKYKKGGAVAKEIKHMVINIIRVEIS